MPESGDAVDRDHGLLPVPVEEFRTEDQECDSGARNAHRNGESRSVSRLPVSGLELCVVRQRAAAKNHNRPDDEESVRASQRAPVCLPLGP